MRNEVLRMEKVTLRERGVTQLDNLNLHIFEGEIMGLVPIDTHGLTALCDLLRENLPLHYGYVFYREKLINTCPNIIYRYKLTQKRPLIVEVPDRHGEGDVSQTIEKYVSEAIGIKL